MLTEKMEIENLSKLRDTPQILQIHSILLSTGSLILLTEYVNPPTLKSHLANSIYKNKIPKRNIFLQLLRAVQRCHEKKIVHRDIKMENVLCGAGNEIVLVDFGFSIDLEKVRLNKKPKSAGTLVYMAPEVFFRGGFSGEWLIRYY